MKQPNEMTREEFLRERIAAAPPALLRALEKKKAARQQKLAQQAVLAPVSDKMAAAAKANPESVRVSARADDGVTIIERPWEKRPPSGMVVVQVDGNGRPALARSYNQETNSYGFVEFKGGYGPPTPNTKAAEMSGGARHEYNPLDALRSRDDE